MALVAPQIERLTFAVIHASVKRAGPRLVAYGVPLEAVDIVGQLRTGLAARPVSAAGLAAVYRYRDAGQVRRNLDTLASAGIIEQADGGAIRATGTGRALLTVMYESGAEAAARLWSAHRETVAGLNELAGRLVVAAAASGGDAYAALASPYEPPERQRSAPHPPRPTPALRRPAKSAHHYARQLARDIDAGRPPPTETLSRARSGAHPPTQALSLTWCDPQR